MNIGFYGHSAASWYGNKNSFINQIEEQLNCKIVNIGVPQGSEERVLFDLKKTKKLDIAVIFHQCGPRYMFLPKCNRDITMDTVPENKSKILWTEADSEQDSQELFENEFFSYGKIKEVFGTPETFIECIHYYKNYLYHPDLQRNRFESATLMVDTYCAARVPKVIHISEYPYDKGMPWFSFKSGIVAKDVSDISMHHYAPGTNPNNISDEGNRLIAERLVEIIKQNNWHV
jgi:hypothetical protein